MYRKPVNFFLAMIKLIFLIFLIFLLYSCGLIIESSKLIRTANWAKKGEVVNVVQHDTVPFEIIGNWVVISLTVAGEKHKYCVDTGAPTILDLSDVVNDGIVTKPSLEKTTYNFLAGRQVYYASANRIDTVAFGKNQYFDVGALTLDFKYFSNTMFCEDISGVLGANIMKHGIWSFNYKDSTIILGSDISDFDLGNSFVFDFCKDSELDNPVFNLNVGDKILKTLIDTGNPNHSFLKNNKVLNGQDRMSVKQTHILSRSLIEQEYVNTELEAESSSLMRLTTSDFDNDYLFTVSNSILTTNKALGDIDLIMGYDFLKDFVTTIDWINNKVYFQPIQKPDLAIKPSSKNMNIFLSTYDKKTYVSSYLNTYFEKGSINIGDTVKEINHIPIEEILNEENYCEIIRGERQLSAKQDTTIITVKNKLGEIRHLKMYDVQLFD